MHGNSCRDNIQHKVNFLKIKSWIWKEIKLDTLYR